MTPFLSDDEPTMRPYLDRFAERGWVRVADADVVAMAEEGKRAHQRIAQRVGAQRAQMTECLSPDGYRMLMNLLRRVGAHLETQVPETAPR